MFDLIAFDADDTLWHTEHLYQHVQDKFEELLSPYTDREIVAQHLYQKEMSNLELYGYGIKSFTLSMIETAIELSRGQIIGAEIQQVIDLAKGMITAGVQLIDRVEDTIRALARSYSLMILTKGDLLDQESKLARSGIGKYFQCVEVVSNKTTKTYHDLLKRYGIEPGRFLMVGNSLKSDILPVLELGAHAVYIPHQITWAHERVDAPLAGGYHELEHIGQLLALLEKLKAGG